MASPPQAIKASANQWLVLVFLSLGYFMILLDTTIVNIAIPSIIPALHSSLDQFSTPICWSTPCFWSRLADHTKPRAARRSAVSVASISDAGRFLSIDSGRVLAAEGRASQLPAGD
jgi:MFS family permease